VKDLLEAAIHERKILRVFYAPGWRTVEPHALGFSRSGSLLLRCYQSFGVSKSGEHVNWKLLTVRDITEIEDTGDHFETARPGYNRTGDAAMKGGIIAKL
jgi:hypothetical protein